MFLIASRYMAFRAALEQCQSKPFISAANNIFHSFEAGEELSSPEEKDAPSDHLNANALHLHHFSFLLALLNLEQWT